MSFLEMGASGGGACLGGKRLRAEVSIRPVEFKVPLGTHGEGCVQHLTRGQWNQKVALHQREGGQVVASVSRRECLEGAK